MLFTICFIIQQNYERMLSQNIQVEEAKKSFLIITNELVNVIDKQIYIYRGIHGEKIQDSTLATYFLRQAQIQLVLDRSDLLEASIKDLELILNAIKTKDPDITKEIGSKLQPIKKVFE